MNSVLGREKLETRLNESFGQVGKVDYPQEVPMVTDK